MVQAAITDENSLAGNVDKLHVLSVEAGRYPNKAGASDAKSSSGTVWEVKRAGFQFRVQSRVPLQDITQPAVSDKVPADVVTSSTAFYAKPMQITSQLVSEMIVTISKMEPDNKTEPEIFTSAPVVKSMPAAMWAQCEFGRSHVGRR